MENTNLPKTSNSEKVAENTPKLNFFNIAYMKEIEEKNQQRVAKLMKQRKNNRLTAGLLSLGVLAIYGYTIHSMKQETFLDDFNEPETLHD